MRRRFAGFMICAAVLCAAHAARAQKGETFKARLSTVPMDVSMMSTIAGTGSATAVLTGRKLVLTGTFEGLRSPATTAQMHRGATKGIRGPALFELSVSKATSGTISGTLELTRDQVEDLSNGRFYLQIQSERAPDGNLWGWLLR
jgi:CHRD domain